MTTNTKYDWTMVSVFACTHGMHWRFVLFFRGGGGGGGGRCPIYLVFARGKGGTYIQMEDLCLHKKKGILRAPKSLFACEKPQ